jgi:hypothetical protein
MKKPIRYVSFLLLLAISFFHQSAFGDSARILNVQCGPGQTVYIDIQITSQVGIQYYALWSTWGGGGEIETPFTHPLPQKVREVIPFTHQLIDPFPREHEFGLRVILGNGKELWDYRSEPGGRCPGH